MAGDAVQHTPQPSGEPGPDNGGNASQGESPGDPEPSADASASEKPKSFLARLPVDLPTLLVMFKSVRGLPHAPSTTRLTDPSLTWQRLAPTRHCHLHVPVDGYLEPLHYRRL